MAHQIIPVRGPRTASVDRPTALEQLQKDPRFPKGAVLHDFREQDGYWFAELKVESAEEKTAAPPPFVKETPVDDEAPDSEPPSEAAPEDDSSDEPKEEKKDDSKDEKSDDDKGEGKKSVEETLSELSDLVHAIADKIGVDAPGDDSPLPGDDLGDVPPPPDAPPTDGPPHGGPGGAKGPSKLKPGEVPNVPGVVPIGAPAFSSVQVPDDHPFKNFIGKMASFTVNSDAEDGDVSIADAVASLEQLVTPYGYKVRRARHDYDGDQRVVRALISAR